MNKCEKFVLHIFVFTAAKLEVTLCDVWGGGLQEILPGQPLFSSGSNIPVFTLLHPVGPSIPLPSSKAT